MKLYLSLLFILPAMAIAQSDLQKLKLKGNVKIKTTFNYTDLKGENISDSSKWYVKTVMYFDSAGNFTKIETYIKPDLLKPKYLVTQIAILKFEDGEKYHLIYDEKNVLTDKMRFQKTTANTEVTTNFYLKSQKINMIDQCETVENVKKGSVIHYDFDGAISLEIKYQETQDKDGMLTHRKEINVTDKNMESNIFFNRKKFDKYGNAMLKIRSVKERPENSMFFVSSYEYY